MNGAQTDIRGGLLRTVNTVYAGSNKFWEMGKKGLVHLKILNQSIEYNEIYRKSFAKSFGIWLVASIIQLKKVFQPVTISLSKLIFEKFLTLENKIFFKIVANTGILFLQKLIQNLKSPNVDQFFWKHCWRHRNCQSQYPFICI